MPRLRSTRYLTCFYCGKRSNTRYDGVTRQFTCLYCDADNFLDENGEITDPPTAATDRRAKAEHFANPRPSSPTFSSQDGIFCATCLKNQRLFTASLAQYLPDDPDHPDYPELERNYYRYRKGLEERYPQVCEECAERVEAQIRKAGYTAKTDHLRRMMEKSKGRRVDARRRSGLDWANSAGRSLWWGGLVLQVLWHVRAISPALQRGADGMVDPDDLSWSTKAISGLDVVVGYLPESNWLINLAIAASICSLWWNPQFVQVTRGFSRHLLGLTQWYSFQGLIVFFRFVFRRVLNMDGEQAQSRNALVSAHLVMAALMVFIYTLAKRSIRIDTTPLFGSSSAQSSPKITRRAARKRQDSKTFSELLTEAIDAPTLASPRAPVNQPLSQSFQAPRPVDRSLGFGFSPETRFNGLNLNPPTPQRTQQVQYSDEMDWSPTQSQSQHRAFSSSISNGANRPFGESPTQPENSPFWYKVPPAPLAPAQRLRNPNMPVLISKPAEKENIFFRSREQAQKQQRRESDHEVAFNQPRFFAPTRENDEANSLADMLSSSFTLSQEQEEEEGEEEQNGDVGAMHSATPRQRHPSQPTKADNASNPFAVDCIVIASLLFLWLLTVAFQMPFSRELRLSILAGAGSIALRVTGDTKRGMRDEQTPAAATYIGSALGVLSLTTVCWLGLEVWKDAEGAEGYGAAVLGMMLGHQVWNIFM